jgi:DNA-binding MarR family transcriptional regulator
MSGRVVGWAFAQPDLSASQKLTLVALADNASDDGTCWPSQTALASKTGLSERTVRTSLGELEKRDLLSRQSRLREDGRGRTSDLYSLAVDDQPATASARSRPTGNLRHDQPATAAREPSGEPSRSSSATTRQTTFEGEEVQPLTTDRVANKKITDQEWLTATALLRHFNERFHCRLSATTTRGAPSKHVKPIIGQMREHPELERPELLAIIDRACDGWPYWEERGQKTPSVTNIFGGGAFERYLGGDDGRPTHRRSFEGERPPPKEGPW